MATTADPTVGLSPRMREALRSVLWAQSGSVEQHNREPQRWVRGEPKPTVQALLRRGLLESWRYDYPIGGFRGRLTDAGVAARLALKERETGHELRIVDEPPTRIVARCRCGWVIAHTTITDAAIRLAYDAHLEYEAG